MTRLIENTTVCCPRCGKSFGCQAADIQQCFCRQVPLTAATLEKISKLYAGCLCRDCLLVLSKEFSESTK